MIFHDDDDDDDNDDDFHHLDKVEVSIKNSDPFNYYLLLILRVLDHHLCYHKRPLHDDSSSILDCCGMHTQTTAHEDTRYNVVIENVISLKTSLKCLN
jgi:hypothetical protein